MQISKELKQSSSNRMSAEEIDELCFADMSKATPMYLNGSAIKLMENLERLCKIVKGHESEFYLKARDLYCALNIELNKRYLNREQGATAPAFRKRLNRSPRPSAIEIMLSNDTQVIDFHYFWLKGGSVLYQDGAEHIDNVFARKAVSGKVFDFDAAYRFAATAGVIRKKLTYLDIYDEPMLQWELVSLVSDDIRDSRKEVERKKKSVKTKLSRLAPNQYITGNERVWSEVVAAEETLKAIGKERKPSLLIETLRMRSGLMGYSGKQLTEKLKSAGKHLRPKTPV